MGSSKLAVAGTKKRPRSISCCVLGLKDLQVVLRRKNTRCHHSSVSIAGLFCGTRKWGIFKLRGEFRPDVGTFL